MVATKHSFSKSGARVRQHHFSVLEALILPCYQPVLCSQKVFVRNFNGVLFLITGLEKSAAIRSFATKLSRLASETFFLADGLATENCRLGDRLATKLFCKADNADAD